MHRIHLHNNLERRRDISIPVYQCLSNRWKRGDTAKLLAKETGRSVSEVKRLVAERQTHLLFDGVEKIIDRMRQNLLAQDLSSLPKIIYHEKEDPSSHKLRTIGVESIEQQLYDEVADYALQPLKKRIGTYQIACLRGKGGALGNRALRRWMRDKRVRWAVQADVKKCYESIDRRKLMGFLRHAIKGSPRVLWLIEALISTHRKGLNIGCKLSQDLVNIYWNAYYHAMLFVTRPEVKPLQMYLYELITTTQNLYEVDPVLAAGLSSSGMQAAAIVVSTVPILLVYPFLQKYFVKGLTVGSVKG